MRAGKDSVASFRNSEPLKRLRRNMLAGQETPEICQRCIDEEKIGAISRRSIERAKGYLSLAQAGTLTEDTGTIAASDTPISLLDLRLGNHCNLACITCGPSQSTGWYREWYHTKFKGFRDGGRRHQLVLDRNSRVTLADSPYGWYREEKFWNELSARMTEVKEIHFSGGEPFLSGEHASFLRRLVETGHGRNIRIDYNTNLTHIPPALPKIWEHFRQVTIGVSIDGFASANNYIRYPSDFGRIWDNLRQLDRGPANLSYWATHTVCALSAGLLPELLRWVYSAGLDKMNRRGGLPGQPRFLSYHLLRKPAHLNLRSLPPRAKEIIAQRLRSFLNDAHKDPKMNITEEERPALEEMLQSVLAFLQGETAPSACAELHAEIVRSDNYRRNSFASIDPEIWACIAESELSPRKPEGTIDGAFANAETYGEP